MKVTTGSTHQLSLRRVGSSGPPRGAPMDDRRRGSGCRPSSSLAPPQCRLRGQAGKSFQTTPATRAIARRRGGDPTAPPCVHVKDIKSMKMRAISSERSQCSCTSWPTPWPWPRSRASPGPPTACTWRSPRCPARSGCSSTSSAWSSSTGARAGAGHPHSRRQRPAAVHPAGPGRRRGDRGRGAGALGHGPGGISPSAPRPSLITSVLAPALVEFHASHPRHRPVGGGGGLAPARAPAWPPARSTWPWSCCR